MDSQYCQDLREASEAGHLSHVTSGRGSRVNKLEGVPGRGVVGAQEEGRGPVVLGKEEVDMTCGWSIRAGRGLACLPG